MVVVFTFLFSKYISIRKGDNELEYRPCIDIHNGKVKQIVGESLKDEGDFAKENFVSERGADFFAAFFKEQNLSGGHVIMLNPVDSPYYQETKKQALDALAAFDQGMMIGGGIHDQNADEFLDAGASHVIMTSFIFHDGVVDMDRLIGMKQKIGQDKIVLDLSCKKKNGHYYVVTDRWTRFSQEEVDMSLLNNLSSYCSEFLIHAADVEGKSGGVDEELLALLGEWEGIPITYAGGVACYDDILKVKELGQGRLNLSIGSALDLYGGSMNYETMLAYFNDV